MSSDQTYLSQNDTIMWTVESDPLLRSTIVGVALLASAPHWDDVVAQVEHAVAQVPVLRRKVVAPPAHPTTLRWVDDDDFELSDHLHRVHLDHVADHVAEEVDDGDLVDRALLDLARAEAAIGLDHQRPLWEFTLVEGLRGGRAAFVMKVHHVVTDGIGAVQLAAQLFDFDQDAPPRRSAVPPAHPDDPWHQFVQALGHDVEVAATALRQGASRVTGSLVPTLLRAVRHPVETVGDLVGEAVGTVASIGRTVAPTFTELSPIFTERSVVSAFRTVEVDLDDLRSAAHRADGSLNDAFLGGITGGLRRYHEHHGAEVSELRVAMPISLRSADDAAGGNHVTVMRFVVPVAEADPRARLAELHRIGAAVRAERSLRHTEAIAGVLNVMPKGVIGSMLKKVDFLASNVPGVPVPLYLAGAEVLRWFPFGPTAGSAVNVTLMSYRGTCCIGVHTDGAAIPDPDVFAACLRDGFTEVTDS